MTPRHRLLATAGLVLALALPARADGPAAVRVHLPRSVSVGGGPLRLADVALLQCPDAETRARAEAVSMGRAPWSGERLVIERATVAARLASHGLKGEGVRFTGAEEVTVTRAERAIPPDALEKEARAFLRKTRPAPDGCRWRLRREPARLLVPAGSRVALTARPAPHRARGEAKVAVVATADGKEVATAEVVFRMAYRRRHLVAARDIAPGQAVSPENTEVRSVFSDEPGDGDWSAVYGGRAVRLIPAGEVVRPGLVEPAGGEILVRRNQGVVMRIAGDCFQITALGRALENGRARDLIKVRNVDSGRVVIARVARDGTVEPVIGER